jgi:probable rRNA maturation factor
MFFDRPMNQDDDPDPSRISVEISDTQSHLKIDCEALRRLVRATLSAEGIDRGSISLAIVDDPTIQAINRRHLDHDWPTDVITFPLSEPDEPSLSAELVVSGEMASQTAREASVDPWHELALYVVHGLLHLCGHDDRTVDDRAEMRRRESEILARSGLSNTFPAVFGSACSETESTGERESARCTV